MNWNEALNHMRHGGRITRISWLKYDHLYMINNIVYDDGGNKYTGKTYGKWFKWFYK